MTLSVAAQAVLARLETGPASTIELQADCPTTHAPKQIYDLDRAGYRISRVRLPNRVMLYTLVGDPAKRPDAPVAAAVSNDAATASRAPAFGDVEAIRLMRVRR